MITAGPKLASDPAAFYDPTTGEVRVAATELAPHRGDVVVFSPDDVGGRVWSVDDVTQATTSLPVAGGLAAVLYGGAPTLFGADPTGNLIEYVGTDGARGTSWTATNLTAAVAGAPEVAGTPVGRGLGHAASRSRAWRPRRGATCSSGRQPRAKGAFVATDVSLTGAGPTRTVAGTPRRGLRRGAALAVRRGRVGARARGHRRLRDPVAKWAQAIKDGWPILGVTGGLGDAVRAVDGRAVTGRRRPSPTSTSARSSRRATCARRGSASGP